MRTTLATGIDFSGIGLHSGQKIWMTIAPAPAGAGISFLRVDAPEQKQSVPARYDLVTDTTLCTRLTNEHGVSVGTVEHVMAALAGCGITDAIVALDGPEVPIMDGSAAPFVRSIAETGLATLNVPLQAIRILRPIRVEKDGKLAELSPADQFEIDFQIDFSDPVIGKQRFATTVTKGVFAEELSDCRTFGYLSEVERLRSMGLARGGSLRNAIVVDNGRILNPEGLRHPDEFVRHKILDAIGDLALAGAPILGRYRAIKSGHEMTNLLLRALFAQPDCWVHETVAMQDGVGSFAVPPVTGELSARLAV